MVSVDRFLAQAAARLADAGIDGARTDARLLLQGLLNMRHEDVLMHGARTLAPAEESLLDAALRRRLAREPVSRILGLRAFWKGEYLVTPDTLDPRADSETVVEAALRHAPPSPARVLDLGTGTGCLLLSLLQEWWAAQGTGIDISPGAADAARENARRLGLDPRAEFIAADWMDFNGRGFDVVVSNPPYIAADEMPGLAPEVTLYDPRTALVAEEGGLAAYRQLVEKMPFWLKKGGIGVFETGFAQARAVKDLLAAGGFDVLEVTQDLGGRDRAVAFRHKL